MSDPPKDHQDHHPRPELPRGPERGPDKDPAAPDGWPAADPTQIVIEPSGPLPPVPSSPLLNHALFLSFLAPLIGWQTGHLIWGIVGAPVVFVVLSALGSRHLLSRVNGACAELVEQGRPLDIVPFLHKCHLSYPGVEPIRQMLDQALAAVSMAEAMQRADDAGSAAGDASGEAPARGEIGAPRPDGAPAAGTEILVSLEGEPELRPPADKVVSGLAVAAWILAAFALLPVVGALPALALLVVGILLVARPQRPLDRKVGVASIGVAGISLALTLTVALGAHFTALPALSFKAGQAPWLVKAVSLAVLMISIILHECAHGLAAWWAGDTTARDQGRLTLNPIPHIDLFGSIALPAIMALLPGGLMFGWAKPVPVNPLRFRRSRLGNLGVSLAGVSVNLMLALFCAGGLAALAIGLRAAYPGLTVTGFLEPWQPTRFVGVPDAGMFELLTEALKAGLLINLVLANLNILPIPPLDGFHVTQALLPQRLADKLNVLNAFGFLIFMALLFLRVIDYLLLPGLLAALLLLIFAGSAGGMS